MDIQSALPTIFGVWNQLTMGFHGWLDLKTIPQLDSIGFISIIEIQYYTYNILNVTYYIYILYISPSQYETVHLSIWTIKNTPVDR